MLAFGFCKSALDSAISSYTLFSSLEALSLIVLLLLISRLIHEDSLTGTTAFWLTRPVSRMTMLSAKTVFTVCVLVVPTILLDISAMAVRGISLKDTILCLGEIYLVRKLALPLAMLVLAVLTSNLSRMLFAGVILTVSLALALILGEELCRGLGLWPHLRAIQISAAFIRSFIAAIFCIAAIAHQFRTRNTFRSALIVAIGILLWGPVAEFWPYDFVSANESPVDPALFDSSSVAVTVADGTVDSPFKYALAAKGRGYVSGALLFANVSDGFIVRPVSVRSSLTFPDGTVLTQQPDRYTDQGAAGTKIGQYTERRGIEKALGGIRLLNPDTVGEDTSPESRLITLDAGQYWNHENQAGVLRADVKARVSRMRIADELPVRTGVRLDRGSSHWTVSELRKQPNRVFICIDVKYPRTTFVDTQIHWNQILLVNRGKNQALNATRWIYDGSYPHASGAHVAGLPLVVDYRVLKFEAPEGSGVRIDDAWLADATLLLIREEALGTFEKPLEVADFRMGE
jgi:hypothetical protein